MMNRNRVYIWLPLVIGLSIAIGLFIGNRVAERSSKVGLWNFRGTSKLDQIIDYINQAYVDTVNTNELVEKAIPTILSELDPHSSYISAKDMERIGKDLDATFSGIGVEFMIQNDTITIVGVIYGGPSEAAGIYPGDRIIAVNDTAFVGKELSNDKVFKKLRGVKGTKVNLEIKRHTSKEALKFTITRADVPMKSVETAYMLTDKIGYIKVSKFAEKTYDEFISAIAKLKQQGCESFVIDLQQNAGGYLSAVIKMANEFIPGNELIVYTEGRAAKRKDIFADSRGSCKENQIVVLIDEGSGSSSEIFAGAIQDNDRGLIVGRRSFGKGFVQAPFTFSDGSELRLTISRYYTPSGRSIQKPYEIGKNDEYGMDILNRYNRGEFDSRDSIKIDSLPAFKTAGGRTVYGNIGIIADVFIPRDTLGLNAYYLKVRDSGCLRGYAFDYADKNRDALKKHKDWEKAYAYLQTQPLVNNLVAYAEEKGIYRRPKFLEESRGVIKRQLEAFIIRNIFGDEGFYQIYLGDDTTIKTAVKLIEEKKATPKAISAEEYKN